jgi:hypothetical protein
MTPQAFPDLFELRAGAVEDAIDDVEHLQPQGGACKVCGHRWGAGSGGAAPLPAPPVGRWSGSRNASSSWVISLPRIAACSQRSEGESSKLWPPRFLLVSGCSAGACRSGASRPATRAGTAGDLLGPAIPGTGRLDDRPRASAATARTAAGEGRRLVDRAYYVREPKYPFHHDIRPVLLTPLPLAEGTRCTGRCTVTARVWGGSCKYPVVKRRWHPAAGRLRCFSKGFPRASVGCLPPM